MSKQIHELPAAQSVDGSALVPLQQLNSASPSGWSTVAATVEQVAQAVAQSPSMAAALHPSEGVSTDAGNVLTVGVDGKPLLTDAAVKAHQSVTTQTWDAVNKVLAFTNEAGTTLTVNLAAVDAHLESATLQAGILVLHGADGEPDVTVDLTAFLQAVATRGGSGIAIAGTGTAASPLQIGLVLDPAAGNLLSVGPNGMLARQANADWNATSGPALILNKPSLSPACPTLIIELGHSQQPNGGLGIDNGDHYQPDCRIGVASYNGVQYTTNTDGTLNVQDGLYLVAGSATIWATGPDTYPAPAPIVFALGQSYGWPGVYQYAVQVQPDTATSSIATSGAMGSVRVSGVLPLSAATPVWIGFSKVLGSQSQRPLALRGHLSLVKIG